MSKKFNSDLLASVHASATALLDIGAIDKTTMRTFDESCLSEVPQAMAPCEIRELRQRYQVSQPVFAKHLNTSPSTVKQWESGEKRPGGMALKLLSIVDKHGLDVLS